jgi:aspartokinase-like uncharacterized kinase
MKPGIGDQESGVETRERTTSDFRLPALVARVSALCVVKLGGSLLSWPAWPAAFRRWLATHPDRRTILIVGGGGAANTIRDWDRTYRLDPSDAHWLAIDAMSLTSRLAARLLPEAAQTDDWSALFATGVGTPADLCIFDPRRFLEEIEPTAAGTRLPESWDVTSDSISARIAELLRCEELVLLKSRLPEPWAVTLADAAATGFVDRCFPTFAAKVPLVRGVNLRDGSFAGVRWSGTSCLYGNTPSSD